MIKSMTGFGKSTESSPYGKVTVEIKTLNYKQLSISCNPLNGFFLLEERIKKAFERKIFRGKAFIMITVEGNGERKSLHRVKVNEDVAREYLRKIKKAQKDLGVKGEIHIRELIELPGVMESSIDKTGEKLWPYVKKALDGALDKVVAYRKNEGMRLGKDFNIRLRKIRKNLQKINEFGKQSVTNYRKKLGRSIQKIAKDLQLDKGRLETEVALFAKNCDITEEITRLRGHLVVYKAAMSSAKTDVGKKLDFIAQEMQREINTIGAKSSDLRISKAVIEVKSEIEKMREQVRNIE